MKTVCKICKAKCGHNPQIKYNCAHCGCEAFHMEFHGIESRYILECKNCGNHFMKISEKKTVIILKKSCKIDKKTIVRKKKLNTYQTSIKKETP